jgi:hypothetical protein
MIFSSIKFVDVERDPMDRTIKVAFRHEVWTLTKEKGQVIGTYPDWHQNVGLKKRIIGEPQYLMMSIDQSFLLEARPEDALRSIVDEVYLRTKSFDLA